MKTLLSVVKSPSALDSFANYIGERPDEQWLCLLTQNRDSDCLTRSNFRSALKELGGETYDTETDTGNVRIDRFGHWACGWWESLSVRQGTDEHKIAEQIESRLANYPVVDEQNFSQLETEEADQVWRDCYRPKERVEYIRKHRSQFEFRTLSDLIGCVRGHYFAGYASELLH